MHFRFNRVLSPFDSFTIHKHLNYGRSADNLYIGRCAKTLLYGFLGTGFPEISSFLPALTTG